MRTTTLENIVLKYHLILTRIAGEEVGYFEKLRSDRQRDRQNDKMTKPTGRHVD